jgi:hypothetical protein
MTGKQVKRSYKAQERPGEAMLKFVRRMNLTIDQVTNALGAIAAIGGTLASLGIYPQILGPVAASAAALVAWFVDKQLPPAPPRRGTY